MEWTRLLCIWSSIPEKQISKLLQASIILGMPENNVQNFSLVNSGERHLLHSDYLEMSPACWG